MQAMTNTALRLRYGELSFGYMPGTSGASEGVCAHSRPRRDPRATASVSFWSCVCPHVTRSVSGRCVDHVNLLMSRKNVCQPAKEWDTFLGFFALCLRFFEEATIKGRLGERGSLRVPRCSSPCDQSPKIYGAFHGPLHPLLTASGINSRFFVVRRFHPREFVWQSSPSRIGSENLCVRRGGVGA